MHRTRMNYYSFIYNNYIYIYNIIRAQPGRLPVTFGNYLIFSLFPGLTRDTNTARTCINLSERVLSVHDAIKMFDFELISRSIDGYI